MDALTTSAPSIVATYSKQLVRLDGRYPFDDPRLRAFRAFDSKSGAFKMIERLAHEVVCSKAHGQWVDDPLHSPDGCDWASHMLDQQEPPTRTEHPECFGYCLAFVRNSA